MSRETVDRETLLATRTELLKTEKALTRVTDRVATARRALPRVRVEADYRFEGPDGPLGLFDLFDGHSQLAVYHFMFAPDWAEGCPICSFWADNLDRLVPHLAARDVALVLVSNAPVSKLEAYRRQMGWAMPWVSAVDGAFSRDMGVTFPPDEIAAGDATYNYQRGGAPGAEAPGFSTFERDADGSVYHCYSAYARGLEPLNAGYGLLDLMPHGRNEADLPFPMGWVRRQPRAGSPDKDPCPGTA